MITLLLLVSVSLVDVFCLDTNKWSNNKDNCTVTVPGRCKLIDSQLRQSCLGTPLPYEYTSNRPIIDDVAHFDIQTWATLKAVPMCWDKLQIFLCTVYVPECQRLESSTAMLSSSPVTSLESQNSSDAEFSQVVLPERGMCQAVRKACPLLFSGNGIGGRSLLGGVVPKFLQCDIYAPVCRQSLSLATHLIRGHKEENTANRDRRLKFLVSVNENEDYKHTRTSYDQRYSMRIKLPVKHHWYQLQTVEIGKIKGIATCAFPCRSPVYRPEHYILARSLTFGAAIAGILVNISVLCTLRLLRSPTSASNSTSCTAPINQKSMAGAPEEDSGTLPVAMTTLGTEPKRRLPHTALTFIHLSFLVGCFGLLMPHLPGVGDSIACRADGSVRVGEPQTQTGSPILCVICFMLVYVPLLAVALWSIVLDYALFTSFYDSSSKIVSPTPVSPSVFHLRRLGNVSGGINSVGERLRRLQRRGGRGNDKKQPGLLLPPDSCELPKRRIGVNEAMERSMSPASPAVSTKKNLCNSAEMVEKGNKKINENDDRLENCSLPLVCRLIYSNNNNCTIADDLQTIEVQQTTFNSMGSQITCIHIAAFAVPVVFALISLTASEIDGEPLSGLCLVGVRSFWAYCSMVIAPIVLCFLLKVIYLGRAMKSMRRLSSYLVTASYSPVDREMAHRLSMCFRAYVIYILTLLAILTFSVGVHAYAYVEEPNWFETQRLLLFCQLRHRLMGLDGTTALAACRTPFTSGITLFSDPSQTFNSTDVARIRRDIQPSAEEVSEVDNSRPLTGPLFLNLFTYLMVNLVFASMCLLDSTVKQKWCDFLRRIISIFTTCPSKLTQAKSVQPTNPRVVIGLNISNSTFHLPGTFSWWDPGMFFQDFCVVMSPTKPMQEVVKANNVENSFVSVNANRPITTSDVSCGCNRRYSSSTNEESWILSSVGAANAASTVRGGGGIFGGGNASSVVSSNVTGTVAGTTMTVGGPSLKQQQQQPMHKSNSLNSSQSLFMTHQKSTGYHKSKSSTSGGGAAILNSISAFQKPEEAKLMAAAALEHSLARPMRRSRQRRMWSSKTSGRRRLVSRSYSTLGLAGVEGGGEQRRSLNSLLLLHRAASSSTASTSNAGKNQQNLSIESLSRLYAAAAAMELERSRKILDGSGSRRGTTSRISLASSSGAESYNSFNLLAEQAGATWRELWRTRMLLIDALHWAQSVAAENTLQQQMHHHQQNQSTDQQQLIAATSVMMAYLMGQQQQQQQNVQQPPSESCCPTGGAEGEGTGTATGGDGTPDSVVMAALMAATAAAQAAMQQQIQNPPAQVYSMPPMSTTPLKQLPQLSNPPAAFPTSPKACCQPYLLNPPNKSSLTNTASTTPGTSFRGARRDVICHLDASANAAIASPHQPSTIHQQQPRSPWNFQNFPPFQPPPPPPPGVWSESASTDLSQFAMSLGASPYAFVPPPTAHMIAQTHQPLPPAKPPANSAGQDEEEEGSDAFDSEDEVMSTSGDETVDVVGAQRQKSHRSGEVTKIGDSTAIQDYWEEEDPFPTPEGQPSCVVVPPAGIILDPDADDVSSVSQSASQVVVATVHEEEQMKGENKKKS